VAASHHPDNRRSRHHHQDETSMTIDRTAASPSESGVTGTPSGDGLSADDAEHIRLFCELQDANERLALLEKEVSRLQRERASLEFRLEEANAVEKLLQTYQNSLAAEEVTVADLSSRLASVEHDRDCWKRRSELFANAFVEVTATCGAMREVVEAVEQWESRPPGTSADNILQLALQKYRAALKRLGETVNTAAGLQCKQCGRGRGVWLAPDESPCKCVPGNKRVHRNSTKPPRKTTKK
jgi:chromosome segregation ATPase